MLWHHRQLEVVQEPQAAEEEQHLAVAVASLSC
jgi:hypothetical protein